MELELRKGINSEKCKFIMVFVLCYFMFVSVINVSIDNNNFIYAIEQLHTYDHCLFNLNPAIMFHEFSPRFIMNHIVSIFMKYLHFSWEDVVVFFIFINIVPYAFGVTNTVFRLFARNRWIYAVLLSLFIVHGVTSGLGMYSMYGVSTIGSAIGIAFAAISYILGDRKNWGMAWILLAIAAAVHIHDGVWGGVFVSIIWLSESFLKKRILWKNLKWMPIYVLLLGICTFPSLLSHSGTLSNKEFIDIYVRWRHPHHLLVSSFGMINIVKAFTYILYPFLFGLELIAVTEESKEKRREKYRTLFVKGFMLMISWCLVLLSMYVLIEIFPVALIAELYPVKYLRYVSFYAVIGYTWMAGRHIEDGHPMLALALLLFAFRPGAVHFAMLSILIYGLKNKKITGNAMFLYVFAASLIRPVTIISGLKVFLLLSLLLYLIYTADVQKRYIVAGRIGCAVLFFALALFSFRGKIYTAESNGTIRFITPHDYLTAGPSEELYQLANEFRQMTGKDTVFLADRNSVNALWLQALSERSCYALEKTVPSSKGSIQEWYSRCMELTDLFAMKTNEINQFMKEREIEYILVDSDKFSSYDESDQFHCILEGYEGNIRIYKALY